METKPVLRRRFLLTSAATLGSGAAFTRSAHAAPADALDADIVPTQRDLAEIRGRKRKAARPPKAANLRDFRKNPYLRPVGEPLSADEQARNKPPVAQGAGL